MDENEIGRLYKERVGLAKEVKGLENKLGQFAKALERLTQPGIIVFDEESRVLVEKYDCDPREDWRKLREGVVRLVEIDRKLPR